VQTLAFRTLYVLLLITHGRRGLVRVGVTAHPASAWVWRQLIEATAWGRRPRHLVRDRDAVYGGDFAARAQGLGIETLLTPVRAPRANAIAERAVRPLRNECLDLVIPLNEVRLRTLLAEFVAYYNAERPHRSLLLEPPLPRARPTNGPIRAQPVLGACTTSIGAPLDPARTFAPYNGPVGFVVASLGERPVGKTHGSSAAPGARPRVSRGGDWAGRAASRRHRGRGARCRCSAA